MSKTLCKSKKLRKATKKDCAEIPGHATHICRRCDRLADCKKKLCKPKKLE